MPVASVTLDRAIITIVADNECDALSSPGIEQHRSEVLGIIDNYEPDLTLDDGGRGVDVFSRLCQACHGYSALLTGWADGVDSTILFDVGPSAELWLANADKLRIELDSIEAIFLSHWHWDHSGGMVEVAAAVAEARAAKGLGPPVVDLHPDRPVRRGLRRPNGDVMLLPEDPTFDRFESVGATVAINRGPHTLGAGLFHASGAIPRRTDYEAGLVGHVSDLGDGFVDDPAIADERFVSFTVAGRGTSVLSACSHAGIVNVATAAIETGGERLDGLFGGYHLAGAAMEPRIESTVDAIRGLSPRIIGPGHCTGWRAKHALAAALPDRFAPSVVGSVYRLG